VRACCSFGGTSRVTARYAGVCRVACIARDRTRDRQWVRHMRAHVAIDTARSTSRARGGLARPYLAVQFPTRLAVTRTSTDDVTNSEGFTWTRVN
jgi:hypothetical protein